LPGGRVRISWTSRSLRQLDHTHAYYAEIDVRLAARMYKAIQRAPRRLARFPASGRKGHVPGTLELVVPDAPFVIVYRVTSDAVEILSVFHTATHWQSGR
jgi:toxin ParE1/3/4